MGCRNRLTKHPDLRASTHPRSQPSCAVSQPADTRHRALGGAYHSMVPILSEGSSLSPGKRLHHQRSSIHAMVPLSDTSPHPEGSSKFGISVTRVLHPQLRPLQPLGRLTVASACTWRCALAACSIADLFGVTGRREHATAHAGRVRVLSARERRGRLVTRPLQLVCRNFVDHVVDVQ
jgi:hypothetical protein